MPEDCYDEVKKDVYTGQDAGKENKCFPVTAYRIKSFKTMDEIDAFKKRAPGNVDSFKVEKNTSDEGHFNGERYRSCSQAFLTGCKVAE